MSATAQQTVNVVLAKGTRDFHPKDIQIRDNLFAIVKKIFTSFGGEGISTPVFELKETLLNKYGEDSKLIYDLEDQGGQMLSLRYDLTVPFARYLAMNRIRKMKRYHIAQVYRRDQPNMNRGRFREFYQCDYDIAGDYATMLPDAECLKILSMILTEVKLGEFTIKTSHRGILDGFMEVCGVPTEKTRTISSAIDKLDKETWENVKKEMIEKGISESCADQIGQYVKIKGPMQSVLKQIETTDLMKNKRAREAFDQMTKLMTYTDMLGCTKYITFDLSLARGLDYYTGIIFEAVFSDAQVGSVAAGGRYDELIGMFSGERVPAVGLSVGVERLMAIMYSRNQETSASFDYFVVFKTEQDLEKALQMSESLRKHGFRVSMDYQSYETSNRLKKLIAYAVEKNTPFMCMVGEIPGTFSIKDMVKRTQVNFSADAETVVNLYLKA